MIACKQPTEAQLASARRLLLCCPVRKACMLNVFQTAALFQTAAPRRPHALVQQVGACRLLLRYPIC